MSQYPPVRLKIKTPAEKQLFSRGFYQEEEEALYIPFFPGGRFFSYLDGQNIRFDIDNKGRLLFIRINTPRRRWIKISRLRFPSVPMTGEIKIINFRDRLPRARVASSQNLQIIHVRLYNDKVVATLQITVSLMVEIGQNNNLIGFWIKGVEEDRAALKMAAWREAQKTENEAQNRHLSREAISRINKKGADL